MKRIGNREGYTVKSSVVFESRKYLLRWLVFTAAMVQ